MGTKQSKKFHIDKSKKADYIAIASGGTGGHIFPAQAVATILAKRYKIIWFTDERGYAFFNKQDNKNIKDNKSKTELEFIDKIVLLKNIKTNSSIFNVIRNFFYITLNVFKSSYFLLYNKPKLIAGFGSHSSFSALLAASILRIPVVLHEQNAVLGRVNRFFLPISKALTLSFEKTINIPDKYDFKIFVSGNPIRQNIADYIVTNKVTFSNKINLLIIGGSQGAAIFSEIIPIAISRLPIDLQTKIIIHQQVRSELLNQVHSAYEKHSVSSEYHLQPFFHNISELLHTCDLVLARAGASTIAEIEHCGKPSILVPLAIAKDNHQYHNSQWLVMKKTAIMIQEHEFTADKLTLTFEELFIQNKIREYKINAKELAKNNASSRLAIKINQLVINEI